VCCIANSSVSFPALIVFVVFISLSLHHVFVCVFVLTLSKAECAISCLLLVAMLLYFPAKPPTAPSVSASVDRVNFCSGLRQLLTYVLIGSVITASFDVSVVLLCTAKLSQRLH